MSQDPRLAEIQLLAHLARTSAAALVDPNDFSQYQLSQREWRDLLFELLSEGCIVVGDTLGKTASYLSTPAPVEPLRTRVERANEYAWRDLDANQRLGVCISHRGRLRLWRLQGELERHRI